MPNNEFVQIINHTSISVYPLSLSIRVLVPHKLDDNIDVQYANAWIVDFHNATKYCKVN